MNSKNIEYMYQKLAFTNNTVSKHLLSVYHNFQ